MPPMLGKLLEILPPAATIAAVVIVLYVVQRLLERGKAALSGRRLRNQLILLSLTAVGTVIVILVLPVSDAMRGQLLSLLGILLTAAIALSSTTLLGNAMAGLMLRAVRNFRMGDFIQVGEHFGRVSERGLFHTEIQTEDRELTTLPNLFLVTHPVTKTRASGTIVSTTVSLGYDVPRKKIEGTLLEAARGLALQEPFVRICELGDFSVTYRIAGLLTETKQLLTVRSQLCGAVMDALHEGDVEIVSPTFMNQRPLADGTVFIPRPIRSAVEPETTPEEVVFDKADKAESLEALRETYKQLLGDIGAEKKRVEKLAAGPEADAGQRSLAALELRKSRLEKIIADRESTAAHED